MLTRDKKIPSAATYDSGPHLTVTVLPGATWKYVNRNLNPAAATTLL